jgi:hypothetical protein
MLNLKEIKTSLLVAVTQHCNLFPSRFKDNVTSTKLQSPRLSQYRGFTQCDFTMHKTGIMC